MIPYSRQSINNDDISAVVKVLKSEFITQGKKISEFENSLSNFTNAKYVTVVNSATSALHLACIALNLQKGDSIWTSPISFVASANCGLYCGANVDFVDINPRTFNMDIDKLKNKLEYAKKNNQLPKIVIPVHFSGQSCNMKEIKKLSEKYKFKIIEDASHAIGGKYKDSNIGSCKYSDITVFSFHPVKIITTGEGGAILTNSNIINKKVKMLRSHGITRETSSYKKQEIVWYYEQRELGLNYRLTDIQAALGLSQLKRISNFVEKRREIASQYDIAFKDCKAIQTPYVEPDSFSVFHLYVVLFKNQKIRKKVINYLLNKNIRTNIHYIPIHTQPYYKKLSVYHDLHNSINYFDRALSLPIYPGLTKKDQNLVIKSVIEAL